jgi:predicted DNA-binding transcriptional regulator AlpA
MLVFVTHHLVGVVEVAKMLGVSRQRVYQLAKTYPDFPQPEVVLAAGRVWSTKDIEGWMRRHARRPGRPAPRPPS